MLSKIKKRIIRRLKRIYKHYRYKIYYPRLYTKYCKEPVIENKVLFLEMRFTELSNSMQHLYDVMEKTGDYQLACSYIQFNFTRGKEFTESVKAMLR